MKEKEIFQILGESTLVSVSNIDLWKCAMLKIKRLEGNVGFESSYVNEQNSTIDIDTSVNYKTAKAVFELYDITQNHKLNHVDWNRAIFTVYPNREFNIEYIWDQELHDEIERLNS